MVNTRTKRSAFATGRNRDSLTGYESDTSDDGRATTPAVVLHSGLTASNTPGATKKTRQLALRKSSSTLQSAKPKRKRLLNGYFRHAQSDHEDVTEDDGQHAGFSAHPVLSIIEPSPVQDTYVLPRNVNLHHLTQVDGLNSEYFQNIGQDAGVNSYVVQPLSSSYPSAPRSLGINLPLDPYEVPLSEDERLDQATQDEPDGQDIYIPNGQRSQESDVPRPCLTSHMEEAVQDVEVERRGEKEEGGEEYIEDEEFIEGEGEQLETPTQMPESTILVHVRADGLSAMLGAMGGPQWTNKGRFWTSTLDVPAVPDISEDLQRWPKSNTTGVSINPKKVFEASHDLMRLFRKAPSLSNHDSAAQKAYLMAPDVATKLREAMEQVQRTRQDVPNLINACDKVAKVVARRFIPIQLLTLKHAFVMGGWEPTSTADKEHPSSKSKEAQIPKDMLHQLIQIVRTMVGLQSVLMRYAKPGSKAGKRWGHLQRHLNRLQTAMSSALKEWEAREEDEEVRIQLLTEKDTRAKIEREERKRRMRESNDRQMELFIASTRRMGGPPGELLPIPGRRSRLVVNSATQRPLSTQVAGNGKRSSGQVYQEENWGWSWDEDNKLMTMLRRVHDLRMITLKNLLPGKSDAEIRSRILELKGKSRAFYEDLGVTPPPWCEADHADPRPMNMRRF